MKRDPEEAFTPPPPSAQSPLWTRRVFIANTVAISLLILLWVGRDYLGTHVFQRVAYSSISGFTTDMRPVDIKLVDEIANERLDLRVPKAYLSEVGSWGGGRLQHIAIQAMLTDMRPRAMAEQQQTALPGTRREVVREAVYVTLASTIHEQPPADDLLRTTGHSSRQSDEYGLQRYRDEECRAPQKDCRVIGYDEIFLGAVSAGNVYIRCARPDIVRDGGCFASTTFRSRLLKYTFQRSKLPQWREIDAKTRQLLAGFVINETVLR